MNLTGNRRRLVESGNARSRTGLLTISAAVRYWQANRLGCENLLTMKGYRDSLRDGFSTQTPHSARFSSSERPVLQPTPESASND